MTRSRLILTFAAGLAVAACSGTPMQSRGGYAPPQGGWSAPADFGYGPSDPAGFPQWTAQDPVYRFFPGDQIEVIVYSAPELNRTLTVGPDGRVFFPLAGPVMAADRTPEDLRRELMHRLAPQLVDNTLDVSPSGYASQQIFVAGEVANPGLFALPGPIDALQAVVMAGGFLTTAKTKQVVVLRRQRGGGAVRHVVDIREGVKGGLASTLPLQRFDVVFVPRSTIAEVNLFVSQYFRDLIGFNVGFSYVFNQDGNADPVLNGQIGGQPGQN